MHINFLAHAHLAYLTDTSITGNLLGDFVKGSDLSHLPADWQQGIRLHRAIDTYTDNHDLVQGLKVELGDMRRYGGIVLDILFDHILAKNFAHLPVSEASGDLDLPSFSALVYTDFEHQSHLHPSNFRLISQRMADMDWLTSYQYEDVLERVLESTSQRISSKPQLHKILPWYQQRQQHVDSVCLDFYSQLMDYTQQQHS